MKVSQRKTILCILVSAIAVVSTLNILILTKHEPSLLQEESSANAKPQTNTRNNTSNPIAVCNNDRIPPLNQSSTIPAQGSTASSILPPHLYPAIHQSCYFLPTSLRHHTLHSSLLQYYPNSFLVITSENEESIRLDINSQTIYIRGSDSYNLLWIKTATLWNYVSTQSNSNAFEKCQWFFKVDTDSFLNLHVIEQYLNEYSSKDDHYVGWFAGVGGRKHANQTVNMAIGSFYGFSRSIIQKWSAWQQDNKFMWGNYNDHKGEDSQVGFFLREHGVCLDVPVVETDVFKAKAGIWEGFERAHPLGPEYFREGCVKKIRGMLDNECFAYAHKVNLDWMPVLAEIMAVHVEKGTRCELFGRGVSRIVNGTIFHKAREKKTQCAVSDCDPCLKDASMNGCCGWVVAK